VAIGVVTGLVQEFQFGMDWGAYSRLVGNIFGAPLAMEGLAAFFLESTFLGLWLFGWDKLPRLIHLLTIWAVSLGTLLSAAFIMAANSWMQHPVGYVMVNGKPQLNDIWALFTNPVFLWGYSKVIFASLVTGSMVMLAVSAWQLRNGKDREVFTNSARLALIVLVPAILFTLLVGDELVKQQQWNAAMAQQPPQQFSPRATGMASAMMGAAGQLSGAGQQPQQQQAQQAPPPQQQQPQSQRQAPQGGPGSGISPV